MEDNLDKKFCDIYSFHVPSSTQMSAAPVRLATINLVMRLSDDSNDEFVFSQICIHVLVQFRVLGGF